MKALHIIFSCLEGTSTSLNKHSVWEKAREKSFHIFSQVFSRQRPPQVLVPAWSLTVLRWVILSLINATSFLSTWRKSDNQVTTLSHSRSFSFSPASLRLFLGSNNSHLLEDSPPPIRCWVGSLSFMRGRPVPHRLTKDAAVKVVSRLALLSEVEAFRS